MSSLEPSKWAIKRPSVQPGEAVQCLTITAILLSWSVCCWENGTVYSGCFGKVMLAMYASYRIPSAHGLTFTTKMIMRPKPGSYYVGVYNNDVYIKEMATFTIKARWSSDRPVDAVCPAECNYQGSCRSGLSTPVCECFTGYGGKLCEGPNIETHLGQTQVGTLMPAAWGLPQPDVEQ